MYVAALQGQYEVFSLDNQYISQKILLQNSERQVENNVKGVIMGLSKKSLFLDVPVFHSKRATGTSS